MFQSLKLGWTWCYLLKCSGGHLLVDTSYPGYFSLFRRRLDKAGIDIADIKYLLLTHHHDDHAGFAAQLVRETECQVVVHHSAMEPLRQGRSLEGPKPANLRVKLIFAGYSLFHREFSYPPLGLGEKDILLRGDDIEFLRSVGIEGNILHTPGHTQDSISVLLENGHAFVGDAVMNFLRFTGIKHKPVYFDDLEQVYRSWRMLRKEGAQVIHPSHGKPFSIDKLGI